MYKFYMSFQFILRCTLELASWGFFKGTVELNIIIFCCVFLLMVFNVFLHCTFSTFWTLWPSKTSYLLPGLLFFSISLITMGNIRADLFPLLPLHSSRCSHRCSSMTFYTLTDKLHLLQCICYESFSVVF